MRETAGRRARAGIVALLASVPTALFAAPSSPTDRAIAPAPTSGSAGTGLLVRPAPTTFADDGASLLGAYSLLTILHDAAANDVDDPDRRSPAASSPHAVFSLVPPAPAAARFAVTHVGLASFDRGGNGTRTAVVGEPSSMTSNAYGALGGVSAGIRQEALLVLRNVTLGADSLERAKPALNVRDPSGSDAFIVWLPHTGVALTGGVAWLRRASEAKRRSGAYASVQLTY